MIFVILLPIPLFIPSFFISVKQQHNHNSQYPEKRSSLYPFPDQPVSISSVKTINLQIVDSKKTEAVNLVDKVFDKENILRYVRFRYRCSILITVQTYDIQKENI